jgi:hypothetical protein
MPTRAQLIADLKGRGVGGKLSKMTKSQLLDLAGNGARRRPMIELEPLPESTAGRGSTPSRKLNMYQLYVQRHMKENPGATFGEAATAYKQHKAGQSNEHMEAMSDALEDGQSLNEAHEEAVEKVDEADYLDQYMSGGSYYDENRALSDDELSDGELELDPYMEGGAYKLEGGSFLGMNWHDIGANALQGIGQIGQMVAMGMDVPEYNPEAAAAEKAAADQAATQRPEPTPLAPQGRTMMSNPRARFPFSRSAAAEENLSGPFETRGARAPATEDILARRFPSKPSNNPQPGDSTHMGIPRAQGATPRMSTGSSAYENRQSVARPRTAPSDAVASPRAVEKLTKDAKKAITDKLGEKGADESWPAYFKRVGWTKKTALLLASTGAEEAGSAMKQQAQTLSIRNEINTEEEDEKQREQRERDSRDAALAADWQRTRDRSENPYLN